MVKASALAAQKKSTETSPGSVRKLGILTRKIEACRICIDTPDRAPLPHEPNPVVRASSTARLLIAGQAPGVRVHASGMPFTDPSGDRLRQWMGIDKETFYDASRIAIVPMGFCFPGHDAKKGDLPPRRECARHWHEELMQAMPQIETILAIGIYAQAWHRQRLGLHVPASGGMTDLVRDWRTAFATTPKVIALPHPSWRNNAWLKKNPWFERDVLPRLRREVARLVGP
ncbi:MAG: uracil-DNA glycosylase [Rhizobiales bacterium 62-17]|nr:uracil-DNA glycosylase family protein [Hyphomicrobiales bacterium]OJY05396.1 MAG: uracil-DNA glycosylase [Rhizobiales bacterium 62-17]